MKKPILASKDVLEAKMNSDSPLLGTVKGARLIVSDKDLRTVVELPVSEDQWVQDAFWFLGNEYQADFNVTLENGTVKCCVYALEEDSDRNVTTNTAAFVTIPVDAWDKILENGGVFSFPTLPI